MKYEWRKEAKGLYQIKAKPSSSIALKP